MENNNRDCKENKTPKIPGKMEEMNKGWNGTKKKGTEQRKYYLKLVSSFFVYKIAKFY